MDVMQDEAIHEDEEEVVAAAEDVVDAIYQRFGQKTDLVALGHRRRATSKASTSSARCGTARMVNWPKVSANSPNSARSSSGKRSRCFHYGGV